MQLIFSKCRFVNPVRINEALIPTTVILVWAQDELLHLNSTLILGDCVGERLALEVAFRYWSCKLVEIPILAATYLCGVFLRKNGSWDELGQRGFMMMMMMMMMMMLNCFCGMINWRKALSFTSSQDYRQRFLSSQISESPRVRFELTHTWV